jgi:oligopeptidase A
MPTIRGMTEPTALTNPLLDFSGLPRFAQIEPAHVEPGIAKLLTEAQAALAQATSADTPADYDALSLTLDVATERLTRAWGAVSHLNSVADTPELRAAYTAMLPKVTEYWTALGQDEALYAKYKAIAATQGAQLSPARRKALDDALRSFVLSGAELAPQAKQRFAEIQERQAELSQPSASMCMDATDAFACFATDEQMARRAPKTPKPQPGPQRRKPGQPGYKLTLHFPSYIPVLQYATDRACASGCTRAYSTRASELGTTDVTNNSDNSAIMVETLACGKKKPPCWATQTTPRCRWCPRWPQSPDQVLPSCAISPPRHAPRRERPRRAAHLRQRQHLGIADLQAWDVAYASEKLKKRATPSASNRGQAVLHRAACVARLVQASLRRCSTCASVKHPPPTAPVWHPSVKFFNVERSVHLGASDYLAVDAKPELVAQFYLDPLPARQAPRRLDGRRARALAAPRHWLGANARGSPGVQLREGRGLASLPLLTHDDVITLFHEFGHGLHHMLTRWTNSACRASTAWSGTPSSCPASSWRTSAGSGRCCKHMTAHVETGEPLPRALFDKMLAAKNFQSGLQTVRQLEFALFDMRCTAEAPGGAHGGRILTLLEGVRQEVAVMNPPAFNRMPHSFSHIFAGGYAAGYYSYKWAEVLSADAYAAFEDGDALHLWQSMH